jgi:hypothetical protein
MGMSLGDVLGAYHPASPNLWILVLIGILVAPPILGAAMRAH